MKITLKVNGREMTFSEKELAIILEEHFSSKTQHNETSEVTKKPTEGIPFEVKPKAIDRTLFEQKRKDDRQEITRQYIVEAFKEMEKNPEKYARKFKTLMPVKNWESKTITEMEELSSKMGGHIADWVEQALEWAQRISNGETWEDVCNNPDTANWYRVIIWKDGFVRFVGGSLNYKFSHPASYVNHNVYYYVYRINFTVPLIVL